MPGAASVFNYFRKPTLELSLNENNDKGCTRGGVGASLHVSAVHDSVGPTKTDFRAHIKSRVITRLTEKIRATFKKEGLIVLKN